MLMTDLDAFSPSVPNLAAHHGTTSSTNRQTRNSASQVKRKRAESSREQQQQNKSKSVFFLKFGRVFTLWAVFFSSSVYSDSFVS